MTFVPETSILLSYSFACLVLFATPGPDMTFVLAQTIARGHKAGFAAVMGGTVGTCIHTALASLGISLLLASSPAAFAALKILGAFYLLWLAIDAVRSGSALNRRTSADWTVLPISRVFIVALGVNLTNPKVIMFFVTFLPQFVDAGDPHATGKLAFLGLYFIVLVLPLCVPLVLGAGRLTALLQRRPYLLQAMDYAFAGVFGAFAVKLFLDASG